MNEYNFGIKIIELFYWGFVVVVFIVVVVNGRDIYVLLKVISEIRRVVCEGSDTHCAEVRWRDYLVYR